MGKKRSCLASAGRLASSGRPCCLPASPQEALAEVEGSWPGACASPRDASLPPASSGEPGSSEEAFSRDTAVNNLRDWSSCTTKKSASARAESRSDAVLTNSASICSSLLCNWRACSMAVSRCVETRSKCASATPSSRGCALASAAGGSSAAAARRCCRKAEFSEVATKSSERKQSHSENAMASSPRSRPSSAWTAHSAPRQHSHRSCSSSECMSSGKPRAGSLSLEWDNIFILASSRQSSAPAAEVVETNRLMRSPRLRLLRRGGGGCGCCCGGGRPVASLASWPHSSEGTQTLPAASTASALAAGAGSTAPLSLESSAESWLALCSAVVPVQPMSAAADCCSVPRATSSVAEAFRDMRRCGDSECAEVPPMSHNLRAAAKTAIASYSCCSSAVRCLADPHSSSMSRAKDPSVGNTSGRSAPATVFVPRNECAAATSCPTASMDESLRGATSIWCCCCCCCCGG
mmetsp:Transcript_20627/g.57537  ORF Transcript_20627/g.57537 Transcript_20627/m.57537 type:complete len:465 (+) Transcript_20627:361-1755(+)